MEGIYVFATREGCHPALLYSAADTEEGRRFIGYHYSLVPEQDWDAVFVLHITATGWAELLSRPAVEGW